MDSSQLVYAEANDWSCNLYFADGQRYIYSYGLVALQADLENAKGFVRVHRSYIINAAYLKSCRYLKAILTTDKRIPLNQHKYRILKRYLRMKKNR